MQYGVVCLKLIDCLGGLVQSPCGKINVLMTLGGEGVLVHDVLQLHSRSADFSYSCDYAFLWLNKSGHTSSSVKICFLMTAS